MKDIFERGIERAELMAKVIELLESMEKSVAAMEFPITAIPIALEAISEAGSIADFEESKYKVKFLLERLQKAFAAAAKQSMCAIEKL